MSVTHYSITAKQPPWQRL